MNLTQLTVRDIKQLRRLMEKRESLDKRLERINLQIDSLGNDGTPRGQRRIPGRSVSAVRRGGLKARIISTLQDAGKQGLHIREIASKLKIKEPNTRVWFYGTGKKIKNIKQVARATYAWVN